jgi:HlyD family secretion protein
MSQPAATPIPLATMTTEQAAAPAMDVLSPVDDPEVADARSSASNGSAAYTGNILADDETNLSLEVSGQVSAVDASEGDVVKTGDILLELDKTKLEARRALALAGLAAAQAQLDQILKAPEQADLDAARSAVTAAQEAYQRALDGPLPEDLRAADAQLRQAEAAVSQAQAAYDLVKGNPNIGALPQSLQLEQATLQSEAAHAIYDKLANGSTADVIAATYAQLEQARALLHRLETGADDAQIRAVQAQVSQAETNLYLATVDLDNATLRAPSDGVVLSVNTSVGEMAAIGVPVIILQSPDVKVEIYVEEARVSELRVGQPAQIWVNAYAGSVFDGEITSIAPALDPGTRTVKATVRPTGSETGLMPGMFATVQLLD